MAAGQSKTANPLIFEKMTVKIIASIETRKTVGSVDVERIIKA